MKFFLPLVFACSIGFTASAQSVVFVNGSTGNDTLNGLSSTVEANGVGPKKTLAAALTLANANDIVSVEAGVYAESATLNKAIQLVKTGEGNVSLTEFTFVQSGDLVGNLPLDLAFQAENVVVQAGAQVTDAYLLTALNGNLIVQAGNYNEVLIAGKSFVLTTVGNVSLSTIRMNANGGTMVLGGPLSINTSIELNQVNGGFLELSAFDLTLGSSATATQGNAFSFVKTSGTGSMVRSIGSQATAFPVGYGTSYAPVLVDENGNASELLKVRVREAMNAISFNPDLPGVVNSFVGLEWVFSEEVEGGNNANVRFDYSGLNELNNWAAAQNRSVYRNDGSTWTAGTNSLVDQSFSSADFSDLGGVFAIYSDFPNAVFSNEDSQLLAYPNPVSDVLFVRGLSDSNVSFELFSIDGKCVRTGIVTSAAFDLSGLQSGAYLLKLISETGVASIPVVKN
jgi:hypothetical protein